MHGFLHLRLACLLFSSSIYSQQWMQYKWKRFRSITNWLNKCCSCDTVWFRVSAILHLANYHDLNLFSYCFTWNHNGLFSLFTSSMTESQIPVSMTNCPICVIPIKFWWCDACCTFITRCRDKPCIISPMLAMNWHTWHVTKILTWSNPLPARWHWC